tara:strand:+ start:283 stop:735 length:453 start_codon:yes stop_codon:yes gene_type:complete
MPIKTFRGQIADGAQDTIVLHTNDGSTGYRIVKFQAVGITLASQAYEALLQIFKNPQVGVGLPGASASIDFSDNRLLGIAYWGSHGDVKGIVQTIIFDNEVFNQDIYITCKDSDAQPCNYYLELEQVKLNSDENTVATLKDIRNRPSGTV